MLMNDLLRVGNVCYRIRGTQSLYKQPLETSVLVPGGPCCNYSTNNDGCQRCSSYQFFHNAEDFCCN